ncbi:hypothetical protein EYR38_009053 [Pleurotus pulmonarius]|nr:hypothetical protein EYR38_009053 [Pleurotus pulmonarius]
MSSPPSHRTYITSSNHLPPSDYSTSSTGRAKSPQTHPDIAKPSATNNLFLRALLPLHALCDSQSHIVVWRSSPPPLFQHKQTTSLQSYERILQILHVHSTLQDRRSSRWAAKISGNSPPPAQPVDASCALRLISSNRRCKDTNHASRFTLPTRGRESKAITLARVTNPPPSPFPLMGPN